MNEETTNHTRHLNTRNQRAEKERHKEDTRLNYKLLRSIMLVDEPTYRITGERHRYYDRAHDNTGHIQQSKQERLANDYNTERMPRDIYENEEWKGPMHMDNIGISARDKAYILRNLRKLKELRHGPYTRKDIRNIEILNYIQENRNRREEETFKKAYDKMNTKERQTGEEQKQSRLEASRNKMKSGKLKETSKRKRWKTIGILETLVATALLGWTIIVCGACYYIR